MDISEETKEKIEIKRPKDYEEFLKKIKKIINKYNFKSYIIYIKDKNNKKIEINDEGKFKSIKNTLFIREEEIKIDNIHQSVFTTNLNKLKESDKEKIEEKYCCVLCCIIIKNENPYFCYICQNIFHEKCLKDWEQKCKLNNKNFECPGCRNVLHLEKWNKKKNYEENR